jgi:hypothetical protein
VHRSHPDLFHAGHRHLPDGHCRNDPAYGSTAVAVVNRKRTGATARSCPFIRLRSSMVPAHGAEAVRTVAAVFQSPPGSSFAPARESQKRRQRLVVDQQGIATSPPTPSPDDCGRSCFPRVRSSDPSPDGSPRVGSWAPASALLDGDATSTVSGRFVVRGVRGRAPWTVICAVVSRARGHEHVDTLAELVDRVGCVHVFMQLVGSRGGGRRAGRVGSLGLGDPRR